MSIRVGAYRDTSRYPIQQIIDSQIAQSAAIERAMLEQKYWDELLEKLRKMGGGGGGSNSRFDRVTVSMQLMNFLSDKTIQAMIKNFKLEFLNSILNVSKQFQGTNQNIFVQGLKNIGKMIFNGFTNIISLFPRRDAPPGRLYNVSQYLNVLAGILSFQLNKLKEILEKDLKELIRKLDLKGKMKKIKSVILDFFVGMKEWTLSVVDFMKSYVEKYLLPSIITGTPRITQ